MYPGAAAGQCHPIQGIQAFGPEHYRQPHNPRICFYQGTEPNFPRVPQVDNCTADMWIWFTQLQNMFSFYYTLVPANLLSGDSVLSGSQWELWPALTTAHWTGVSLLPPLLGLPSNTQAPLWAPEALCYHVNCFAFWGCLSPMFYSPLSEEQIHIDFRTTRAVNYRSWLA